LQYNVDHSVSILLNDPEGRLRGVFPTPHDTDRMTGDLAAAID
jgi:cytochrome oxidase Cu insertion factor (SCO1/SenC/PrrC family)